MALCCLFALRLSEDTFLMVIEKKVVEISPVPSLTETRVFYICVFKHLGPKQMSDCCHSVFQIQRQRQVRGDDDQHRLLGRARLRLGGGPVSLPRQAHLLQRPAGLADLRQLRSRPSSQDKPQVRVPSFSSPIWWSDQTLDFQVLNFQYEKGSAHGCGLAVDRQSANQV